MKRIRTTALTVAAVVLLGVGALVGALIGRQPASLEQRAHAIAARLRCPVCQNLSVADSPSELARDMRSQIRTMLSTGQSPAAIRRFFTDRYGEGILLAPPARGIGVVPWAVPAAAALAGAFLLGLAARRWRTAAAPALSAQDRERVDEALARYADEDLLES